MSGSTANGSTRADWIAIPTAIAERPEYSHIQAEVDAAVQRKIAAGDYTTDELYYVSKVDLALCKGDLELSDERLEKLRRMCQLWDVDVKQREITSHRKFIGPIIVFIKKRTFPILRFFLRDFIRQQKDFNAAAIALVGDLANEKTKGPPSS